MIAVSSFRPLDEDPEYRDNQIAAHRTWQAHFERIVYFNPPDTRLDSTSTGFRILANDFPTIRELCHYCGYGSSWCAILNADIVIGQLFRLVESKLMTVRARCAVSARWNFDPKVGTHDARVTDNGLDFFAAAPDIWRRAASEVPPCFRIGHNLWDTWMLGFFKRVAGQHCWDITRQRVIFHPIHGGRRQPHKIDDPLKADYFNYLAVPIPQL